VTMNANPNSDVSIIYPEISITLVSTSSFNNRSISLDRRVHRILALCRAPCSLSHLDQFAVT
jgi:hypothetical protein